MAGLNDLVCQKGAESLLKQLGLPTDFRKMNLAQVYFVLDYVLQGRGRENITPNMAQWVFEKGYNWTENTATRFFPEMKDESILYLNALARMRELSKQISDLY